GIQPTTASAPQTAAARKNPPYCARISLRPSAPGSPKPSRSPNCLGFEKLPQLVLRKKRAMMPKTAVPNAPAMITLLHEASVISEIAKYLALLSFSNCNHRLCASLHSPRTLRWAFDVNGSLTQFY